MRITCITNFREMQCSVQSLYAFRQKQHRRFWRDALSAMNDDPDLEYALRDGTIVPVHHKVSGAKGMKGVSK
jgi:hypothetical protein